MNAISSEAREPAPSFAEAKSIRQRARAAGMDPNRWYAVEYESALNKGKVTEVIFWKTPIALFRGEDGEIGAVENRCLHRQIKLSLGAVDKCQLRCLYHGWAYDKNGQLMDYSHDSFGKPLLKKQLRSYPVRSAYGLIWLFPGDPALATQYDLPEIPELMGEDPWAGFSIDFTWKTHHSMVIDNICDFSHAFLHRKYRPFTDAKLRNYEARDDRITLTYDTFMAGGRISGIFVDRKRVNTRSIDICYEYPYQWSDTGGSIKHWCFLLPIDERLTRVFFVFYFDKLKIPVVNLQMPRWLTQTVLNLAKPLLFKPLLAEDGVALEAEQISYDNHWDAPPIELNPVVPLFQQLTAKKWAEHLARTPLDSPAPVAETSD